MSTLFVREFMGDRPGIVCLCGSTRFGNFFHRANLERTLAGEIVLSIGCDTKSDADLAAVGELNVDLDKAGLDELHKRKIDLADYCLVVSNEEGYFGDSTWSEIRYARLHGKEVRFTEPAAAARALTMDESLFAGHNLDHEGPGPCPDCDPVERLRRLTQV